jgi:nucleoside-diphosphate kinase
VERTLVLIKPDAVQRGLIGEIITRLERRGLKLVAAKFMLVSQELAAEHYKIHAGKPFYPGLIAFITSSPVVAMVWEGPRAIELVGQTMGITRPWEAEAGSIRSDFGVSVGRNLTHRSDAPETAEFEIALWFKPEEIVAWDRAADTWIFE